MDQTVYGLDCIRTGLYMDGTVYGPDCIRTGLYMDRTVYGPDCIWTGLYKALTVVLILRNFLLWRGYGRLTTVTLI